MTYDLIKNLRYLATRDAKQDEFRPEEHTCWLAADRIEQLEAMIAGDNDPQLLHEIATRLWHAQHTLEEQHEKHMATDKKAFSVEHKRISTVESAGTG